MSPTSVAPTLLTVAHGTADPAGLAEIRRLVDLTGAQRPGVPVELGWLERGDPPAGEILARLPDPVVIVPVLLSTGYHVKTDVARLAADRPRTVIAGQLGPDPRLVEVVRQRLAAGRRPGADVVLFGAGSSDPDSYQQLTQAAVGLRRALAVTEDAEPDVQPRFLTDPDWADGLRPGADVAGYLLAPGFFNDRLRARAAQLSAGFVAPPIGAHPLVAQLIWDRYDQAAAALSPAG